MAEVIARPPAHKNQSVRQRLKSLKLHIMIRLLNSFRIYSIPCGVNFWGLPENYDLVVDVNETRFAKKENERKAQN